MRAGGVGHDPKQPRAPHSQRGQNVTNPRELSHFAYTDKCQYKFHAVRLRLPVTAKDNYHWGSR